MVIGCISNGQFNEVPRLLSLINSSGYEIVQNNGQRRYGPPPYWKGSPPPKGSEVFVGKLPRDCFEDEIVPFVEQVGKIYEMRLMMDFSGSNRGYAFVMYMNPEDAAKAVKELNNKEIRRGRTVGVVKSGNNCRLFVGGIPKTKTKEDVQKAISEIVDGVGNVILYCCPNDKTKNRGFAFVEFLSHREAAMARRKFLCLSTKIWGKNVAVDWAEPEVEVDEQIMSKVKILYVRNLLLETSEEDIKIFFMPDCGGEIERVKKIRDFAFVHFSSREAAEKSMEATKGKKLDGCTLEVMWAKPINQFYHKVKKEFDRRKAATRQHSYHKNIGNISIPVVSQSWSRGGSQSDQNPTYINGFHCGQSSYNCAESFRMSNAVDGIFMSMPTSQEADVSYYPVNGSIAGERSENYMQCCIPNSVLRSGSSDMSYHSSLSSFTSPL
ncbi:APOBEC1 complementation factor-like isoform X2 [Ischnura elegans]|uniref:APOBEC1 complementation factor-like isoform X2 n=1 Tax=Ischnura elegans TaxID=197161 RepID=UPI001ED8B64B|nr:APOBEC1 complementation factor-like isoform X2 [Ischnura elegans]